MTYSLTIDAGSATPKYQQIADALLAGIEERGPGSAEQLPSINELSARYDVSRDTVERAYKVLKRDGHIVSVRGKGYYARRHAEGQRARRVLLVFNGLSGHQREIYEGLAEGLGAGDFELELQVYHDDPRAFARILEKHRHHFTDFVLVPSFVGSGEQRARNVINEALADRHVVIVSSELPGLRTGIGAVTQDYDADIVAGLTEAADLLAKYRKVVLLFDPNCAARMIITGFERWSRTAPQATAVETTDAEPEAVESGAAYVCVTNRQLVQMVRCARDTGRRLGADIGLVAYNDSVLKEVLAGGITVITTDHRRMGVRAAELLVRRESARERVPFRLIRRATL